MVLTTSVTAPTHSHLLSKHPLADNALDKPCLQV